MMKAVQIAKSSWKILKASGAGFMQHKVLKLSAALAYYTIFSIGPMLLVIIFFANLVWQRQAVEGEVYKQFSGLIGNDAALQIQEIIKNASVSGGSFTAIIGFVTLIVAATSVFTEMQDSLNMIWSLKVKSENKGWWLIIRSRLLSFSITASLSFLLLISLVINSLLDGFMSKLQDMFPHVGFVAVYIINQLITLLVTALLFGIIYKVLPDAIISWKNVTAGALFTALLFMIGKFAITFYIRKGNPGSSYGSASSLVILLLWVYYSAVILYFGAEFTKAFSLKYGTEIRPEAYAVVVQTVQIESNEKSVQKNEEHTGNMQSEMQKMHDSRK